MLGRSIIVLLILISHYCNANALSYQDISSLSKAVAEKREAFSVMVAVNMENIEDFKYFLSNNRVKVLYASDEVGYYRLSVNISEWKKLYDLKYIEAISVDGGRHATLQSDIYHSKKQRIKDQFDRSNSKNPNFIQENSASYCDLLGAPFNHNHLNESLAPLDGRGATVAIIEHFVDVAAQDLKFAYDLEGNRKHKISGVYGFINSSSESMPDIFSLREFGKISTQRIWSDKNGEAVLANTKIKMPHAGEFDIGWLNLGKVPGAAHFFSNTVYSSDSSAIVVARELGGEGCVWVDTNRNMQLDDENCIGDYNLTRRTARLRNGQGKSFGPDFYIADSPSDGALIIAFPYPHSQWVASVAVGSGLNKCVSGVAPAASMVSIGTDGRLDSTVEGLIFSAKNTDADVILLMSVFGSGRDASMKLPGIIVDRVSKVFNKLIVTPAGNDQNRLQSVTGFSVGRRVLSVGQYHSSRAYEAFNGVKRKSLPGIFSSGGPSGNGLLKPDVIAPSLFVVPGNEYYPASDINNVICPSLIITSNIVCFSGTSAAAPAAAGAAAIIYSAARRTSQILSSKMVLDAMRFAADPIEGAPSYIQGNGLINIVEAIHYIDRFAVNSILDEALLVDAPIDSQALNGSGRMRGGDGMLLIANQGSGSSVNEVIKISRLSGDRNRSRYRLKVIGADSGSFTVQKYVDLPLNKMVSVPVGFVSSRNGVHSAVLSVEREEEDVVIERISLVVVSALHLENRGWERHRLPVTIGNEKQSTFYVAVPKGLSVLRYSYEGPLDFYLLASSPTSNYNPVIYRHNLKRRSDARDVNSPSQVVKGPEPGLWEFTIVDQRGSGKSVMPAVVPLMLDVVSQDCLSDISSVLSYNKNGYGAASCGDNIIDKITFFTLRKESVVQDVGVVSIPRGVPIIIDSDRYGEFDRLTVSVETQLSTDNRERGGDRPDITVLYLECSVDVCNIKDGISSFENTVNFTVFPDRPRNERGFFAVHYGGRVNKGFIKYKIDGYRRCDEVKSDVTGAECDLGDGISNRKIVEELYSDEFQLYTTFLNVERNTGLSFGDPKTIPLYGRVLD